MQQNIGIVLKKYFPQKVKLSVLDSKLGKIACVPNRVDICVGAFIDYHINCYRGFYFVNTVNILKIPSLFCKMPDLIFFHHVLEICYFFIFEGSPVSEIFELLSFLYFSADTIYNRCSKKIFLCKLFFLLGIYPEDKHFQLLFFNRVASESIDILINETIDLRIERRLDAWLSACLAMHPYVNSFKTIRFLCENRVT